MPAFGSPWLFADCCVLRRLLVPRHSPCALCSLTIFSRFGFRLCVRITWFFGLFLDDNFCVVHVISHMLTLSLPFCLLYLCSVFKVQSWISDVGYWILDLIPISFLKTIVPGVPLPVFKRLPSRITCRFNLPGGLNFESHSALRLMCFSPFRPAAFAAWWAQVDSNHRPHAYQACALTT